MTPELKNKIPADLLQNTTTSYKFFWVISILELVKLTGGNIFELRFIIAKMVSDAALILKNNAIKLGSADHFRTSLVSLTRLYPWAFDTNNTLFIELVKNIDEKPIKKIVDYYTGNVPYRFLTPWVGTKISRADLAIDELMFELDAPYSIKKGVFDHVVSLNPTWVSAITGLEDELINLVFDRLGGYIEHRNSGLPIDYLDSFKKIISQQNSAALPDFIVKTVIRSYPVDIQGKDIDSSSPFMEEESPNEDVSLDSGGFDDKNDVIINGKIIAVRNPDVLNKVLHLVETNKLGALSMLYRHYENIDGLSMSFTDWGNLIDKIEKDNISSIKTNISPSPSPLIKETPVLQDSPHANDALPAFRLVKRRLSEGYSYNQIIDELEKLVSAGHTEYKSKQGRPITKAILSHWAKELGYDVRPGGKTKENLENWKETNEGYQWFKSQILLGVPAEDIIKQYNEQHASNPQSFSTPFGAGMTISTYNRWRRDIVAANQVADLSKPISPSTAVATNTMNNAAHNANNASLDDFYRNRGLYSVIEWAKGRKWWATWKRNFKLFAEDTINEFLDDLTSPANLISNAFQWSLTDEGKQYWEQANADLKNHIISEIDAVLKEISRQVSKDSPYSIKKDRFYLLIGYDENVFTDDFALDDLCERQGLLVLEEEPDNYIFMRE